MEHPRDIGDITGTPEKGQSEIRRLMSWALKWGWGEDGSRRGKVAGGREGQGEREFI